MPSSPSRRLFYAGKLSGDTAYQIGGVAVAWHVFGLHHRPFDIGLVGLALFLPSFVLALPAGIFCDRHDRRAIVRAAALLEAACALAFIVAIARHVTFLPAYLTILSVLGAARAFGTPAERALLPGIVAPAEYMRAQATYSSLRQLTIIGGPALGGVLVGLSTSFALGVAAGALVASAFLLGSLRLREVAGTQPPRWRDAFEGVRFIFSRPAVTGAMSLDLFAVLFGGATALLPAFADGIFSTGPAGLGALRSAPAVGAALVAAWLARRPLKRHVGPVLLAAVAAFGIATIAFGLSKNFAVSLALLALAGASDMLSIVIRGGLVQLATPDAMRGRVNAVENVFIGASNELGEFESGVLAAAIGVVPAVVAGGVGTLVVIALWSVMFPALRTADRFSDAH